MKYLSQTPLKPQASMIHCSACVYLLKSRSSLILHPNFCSCNPTISALSLSFKFSLWIASFRDTWVKHTHSLRPPEIQLQTASPMQTTSNSNWTRGICSMRHREHCQSQRERMSAGDVDVMEWGMQMYSEILGPCERRLSWLPCVSRTAVSVADALESISSAT